MFKLISDIFDRKELFLILVLRNIKIRYKNSVLGFFWTLLVPVFFILIYSFFLQFVMKIKIGLPVLVTGIIIWQFLSMCLGDSLQAVAGNSNLIKKTAFPRIILPLSMIAANLINFLLTLIVLVCYLLVTGADFGSVLFLPLIVLTHVAFCLGISLIVSSINVFFRDTEHILGVVMLAWFFMTPVIYTFDLIPARFHHLAILNPMAGIVSAYRSVFLSVNPLTPAMMKVSLVIAWACLFIGLMVFQSLQSKFADEL
ncbi:ABC transporter permease [Verrucomicrobiota bacterium]